MPGTLPFSWAQQQDVKRNSPVHGFAQQWTDGIALLQGEEALSETERVKAHNELLMQQNLQLSAANEALEAELAAAKSACAAAAEESSRKDSDIADLRDGCKHRIIEREVLRRERNAARRERDTAVSECGAAKRDCAALAGELADLNHEVRAWLMISVAEADSARSSQRSCGYSGPCFLADLSI